MTEQVLFDSEWEPPPQPNRGRFAVVAAVVAIALIVTSVKLLRSREGMSAPNDVRSWVPPARAPAPSTPSPVTELRADLATAPTLSRVDLPEPTEVAKGAQVAPRPRPARAASRAPGYLFINSSPWAELAVDGHVVGNTPQVKIRVTPGRHHLVLVREGFQTHSAWVHVAAGGTVRLTDITLAGVAR